MKRVVEDMLQGRVPDVTENGANDGKSAPEWVSCVMENDGSSATDWVPYVTGKGVSDGR